MREDITLAVAAVRDAHTVAVRHGYPTTNYSNADIGRLLEVVKQVEDSEQDKVVPASEKKLETIAPSDPVTETVKPAVTAPTFAKPKFTKK